MKYSTLKKGALFVLAPNQLAAAPEKDNTCSAGLIKVMIFTKI